jgi:subtilase-type serine protease
MICYKLNVFIFILYFLTSINIAKANTISDNSSKEMEIDIFDQKSVFDKDYVDYDVSQESVFNNPKKIKQKITLKFQNLDFRETMKLMGKIGEINILVGDEITGEISAELVDVPWDTAFQALLDIKNYASDIDVNSNSVKIYSPSLLAKQKNINKNFEKPLPDIEKSISKNSSQIGTEGIIGISALGLAVVAGVAGGSGGSGGSGGAGGDSGPATISFSVSSSVVGECDANITITGNLTKAHGSNVTITYSTAGTATKDTDYTLSSTTSTIVAGATSGSVTLDPTNDTTNEISETVIISANATAVSITGSTTQTITIRDYVLKCNATAFSVGTTSEINTIKGRSSWTEVDASSNTIHPYELVNLHKAHSFKSGSTTLTGNGEVIYVMDNNLHNNHASFNGKTITMLDTPSTSVDDNGDPSFSHGTHVSGIVAGIVGGTSHGVAPDASLVFSTFADNGTAQAADIDTARNTHSAIVMNNSWGYKTGCNSQGVCTSAVEWDELVFSAIINGRNIREQLENESMSVFGSHTATYITALDNFQNNGVIVWASDNFPNDGDVSMMSALPVYFNGTDDSVDLTDAWLTVMYAEFTGSSLSGASTEDFNRLGNTCGAAKEWCLVVDDRQIKAATFINESDASIYGSAGGSSMGAPQVSGMIALLAQAFPNHTPEQLTDRILASANNAWFTANGVTTFTTHGASIQHGYNNEWGHGVPDMEAALSPITSSSNTGSFGFGSAGGSSGGSSSGGSIPFSSMKKLAVSETAMQTSSSLGDAIINGLSGKTAYAYDALNAGFKFNVTDFVSIDSLNDQQVEYTIDDELNNLRNFKFDDKKTTQDYEIYVGEYLSFKNKHNQSLSITLNQPNIAMQNFNLYNTQNYKNPFTTENKGVGFNNNFYFLGNNILLGYNNSKFNPLTNINKDFNVPMETLALSVNLDNDNFDLLSFTTGLLKEENTFLLSEGSGAFNLSDDDNLTNFYGFNFSKSLNNLGNIYFSTMLGNSKLNNSQNSLIVNSSDVLSSSFEINYELKNLFDNNQLNISLSQPNRVEKGDMTFRFMGLADKKGILPYEDHKVSLSPSGRQKDLTLSYYTNHSNSFKTGIKTVLTDDLGHRKSNNLESNILFSAVMSF